MCKITVFIFFLILGTLNCLIMFSHFFICSHHFHIFHILFEINLKVRVFTSYFLYFPNDFNTLNTLQQKMCACTYFSHFFQYRYNFLKFYMLTYENPTTLSIPCKKYIFYFSNASQYGWHEKTDSVIIIHGKRFIYIK